MFGALARRLFGTANDRLIKSLRGTVDAVNALEPSLESLSDEALRGRTQWLRERLAAGESLDDLLVDAFATVREGSRRVMGMRHFDVQIMGGIVLHQGRIAEMKTGEGKTLVATLPTYLNALTGKGVHVVTVNDYLASRDAEWMGRLYRFLGLTTGVIVNAMSDAERQAAYACDITYGTNNEIGFDYLRDNMKFRLEDMVQRSFHYAIVDEVDSILVDEARTPLIISGPSETSTSLYADVDRLIRDVRPEHYEKDEKARTVTFTEEGTEFVEQIMRQAGLLGEGGLYDLNNVSLVHHAQQALRAHALFSRDVDYIVKDGRVVIIDEFTGRMMDGRRYSEGLHQALEAKEGVAVQNENQTLASITFQNLFRLYPKLAGMTGTAMTEAGEFMEIYNLEVVEIPSNRPFSRDDQDDEVYRMAKDKYKAIADLIGECHKRGQPCLVGTTSIEKSEYLADLLRKDKKIKPQVLNARYHEQEAHIIAQAGVPGAVTIATNMAGRGTDIQLGGNLDMRVAIELAKVTDEVERTRRIAAIRADVEDKKQKALAAGGLFVIGTERHESRRIDNQLRGRSGRQGDPGASRFFLSLEDDLMRIFGSERMDGMLRKLGLREDEAIVHPWINKALEKAQQKVEARNFEVRKNLLKYDDVMNDQRKVIYEQRRELMQGDTVSADLAQMRAETVADLVQRCIPRRAMASQWDVPTLHEECLRLFGLDLPVQGWAAEEGIAEEEIHDRILGAVEEKMAARRERYGDDIWLMMERGLLLQILDQVWKDHLLQLDHLRQGITLRAYAQRDPLNEYKSEAFEMFQAMLVHLRERVTQVMALVELQVDPEQDIQDRVRSPRRPESHPRHEMAHAMAGSGDAPLRHPPMRDPANPETWGRVSRNEGCPCGSGRKYKHCHGSLK
ncbi:preprotein translocase subunit SecA [Haematospirillum jordaniae]|uniref:Protein translocase subunit SecA n=1 Tax=Haematospirillum jordaniae TaxID=1549855 RepID=A0A143DDL3_9PROT|nr:preprotein translocase subunit SecA [Haematospirillum jordaniae]AMW34630.1 preprotein translocase subunit SecA [Haematospirillum jordaniae]NKD44842.1 preprotein translocase subunit SecA [Haematospirillum jordaniae]NKD57033.1 preprotein translocase subunit SecA [Haematospirillum jordaniae]NKD58811.1 preprotein translocase subunit SecA [Haematospirillum jordaniae]NKD66958.1 preprotein translocase subunit SecA [Haematospirillum jordaniae]